MSTRPETMPENDVVELLLHQHVEIRRLFTEVRNAAESDRREAFDRLRRLLAVHETAEEMIVHPDARRVLDDGDRVVDARLEEENAAKRKLEELEQMDPAEPGFVSKLTALEAAVLDHAAHEEQEEFPRIKAAHSSARLKAMGVAVKAAEAMAPTHPHAGVESAKANVLVGPYAAMMDRAGDVIRQTMQRSSGDQ
ncbi:hemerythrin domain-containing protein [Saccharothrix sp. ALI-22-I]|uniref:hemerythrin domain-containing protein n=1 Tax=Saccharothrix sp. ALI-22-I TaxID=1933778 RepID=UPI001EE6C0CA|nr:hemerythrin domain-containing protein [Saccharothrix sp. ALI-22-I]